MLPGTVTVTLQHHGLDVVVEDLARYPPKNSSARTWQPTSVSSRSSVTYSMKLARLHLSVDERRQPLASEVDPIDLQLPTRLGLESHQRLFGSRRFQRPNKPAHQPLAAREPLPLDFARQYRRRNPLGAGRLHPLNQVRLERLEFPRLRRPRAVTRRPVGLQYFLTVFTAIPVDCAIARRLLP